MKESVMRLPEAFVQRMQQMLGPEFDEFMASYDLPRYHGIRVNTLKISAEEFLAISPFRLESVPWAREGFYISGEDRPAKHPYYHAGLYYVQEPSAMTPVAVLDPQPGDRVLDLCAAPGGKSTQIAARLSGQGVLVTNDVSHERIKALVRNLEMFGVTNCIVLHELPSNLVRRFAGYFDKIVIDAPCSGEGMFRKDPFAVKSWGDYSVNKCSQMQRSILKNVSALLKPGGYVVYSTCTFNPEENEAMVSDFLAKNPEFVLADTVRVAGMDPGRPEWAGAGEQLRKSVRLWPHKIRGEGHFVALLRKTGDVGETESGEPGPVPPNDENLQDFYDFLAENLHIKLGGPFIMRHSKLYMMPPGLPSLEGLKVIRPGWYLGEIKKNRFKPSAPMAMGLRKQDAKRILDFPSDSREVIKYLKGETLNITGPWGWTLICVDGFPLGWAKQLKDMLNNYYPAGWRWMD